MANTPYRPTADLLRTFFEEMPGAGTGWGGRLAGNDLMRTPSADVAETNDEVRVTVELPGMRPDDIQVDLENNILTIGGEKREERREEGPDQRWHLSERRFGRFARSFVLPRDVERDRIAASFDNGVLTVRIPKSEKVKPRRIEVRSGDDRAQRIETGTSE